MGLDSYLYKVDIKPEIEQVFDKLVGAGIEYEEVLYWRKNYALLEWFRENMCDIDNCVYHEVSKEIFEKWLYDLENDTLEYEYETDDEKYNIENMVRDMDMIMKILKETDFTKTKFFFYNWW